MVWSFSRPLQGRSQVHVCVCVAGRPNTSSAQTILSPRKEPLDLVLALGHKSSFVRSAGNAMTRAFQASSLDHD